MEAFLIIATMLVVLMFAAALVLLLSRSRRGVEIHMDENTQVKMSKSKRGIRVEFVADNDPMRPSDAELFPAVLGPDDVVAEKSTIDRDFVRRLAAFDTASADEKESIVGLLLAKGIISKDEAREWLFEDILPGAALPPENPEDSPEWGEGDDAPADVPAGEDRDEKPFIPPVPDFIVDDDDDGFGGF